MRAQDGPSVIGQDVRETESLREVFEVEQISSAGSSSQQRRIVYIRRCCRELINRPLAVLRGHLVIAHTDVEGQAIVDRPRIVGETAGLIGKAPRQPRML